MDDNELTTTETRTAGFPWLGFLVLLLAGIGLRWLAAGKSFWLDELHSTELAHADLRGMYELLKPDFHAPLFFGLANLLDKLGLIGHDLRLLPALASLLALWPLTALLRQARLGGEALIAAAAVFLLAPYQIRYGVELRPYAFLQLVTLWMLWAAFGTRASTRTRLLVFALAAAAGLYSHYLAAVAILAIGALRLVTPGGGRLPFWKLLLAGTLGVLLFAPWIVEVESWMYRDPEVLLRDERQDPSAAEHSAVPEKIEATFGYHAADLRDLPARCFAPGLSSLGKGGFWLAGGGLGLVAILLILGLPQALFLRGRRSGLAAWGLVGSGLVAIAITAVLCVKIWNRLPIQYFATGAFFWAGLAGIAVQGFAPGRWRRAASVLVVLAALLAGLGEAIGLPREDLEGAARAAVELARKEDAHLSAILRQPGHYASVEVYRVYAPEVPRLEPAAVPRDGRKVVVLTRSTALERQTLPEELIGAIASGRRIAARQDFAGGISVYLYEPLP
ncbi:MAG: glycosyltransferase family 39 protein [Planctomycetes bacterium]|nr:glycosyltransferase family 39 protein [Planctomycetota bacterium]